MPLAGLTLVHGVLCSDCISLFKSFHMRIKQATMKACGGSISIHASPVGHFRNIMEVDDLPLLIWVDLSGFY